MKQIAHLEHRTLQHELEEVSEELLVNLPTRHAAKMLLLDPVPGAVCVFRDHGYTRLRILPRHRPLQFRAHPALIGFRPVQRVAKWCVLVDGHDNGQLSARCLNSRRRRFPLYVLTPVASIKDVTPSNCPSMLFRGAFPRRVSICALLRRWCSRSIFVIQIRESSRKTRWMRVIGLTTHASKNFKLCDL